MAGRIQTKQHLKKKQSECVIVMDQEDASEAKADVVVLDKLFENQCACHSLVGTFLPRPPSERESRYRYVHFICWSREGTGDSRWKVPSLP